jgi:uncharacterized protein
VPSGLTEFAQKYQVKSTHYQAIGDATSAKVGWYDYDRKMFKVIPIHDPSEVSSLTGDIARYHDKPVAHTHLTVSTSDEISRGDHLLELFLKDILPLTNR